MSSFRSEEHGDLPELTILCDEPGCGERIWVRAENPAGVFLSEVDGARVAAALSREGWTEDCGMDRHRCGPCEAARALPPAIEPKPGEPWQPVRGRIGGTGYGS